MPGLPAPKSCHRPHRGWVRSRAEGGTHLAQVVEVVLVMDPAVAGGHAVGAVSDIAGVYAQTVVELALEELGVGTRVTGLVTVLPVLPGGGVGRKSEEGPAPRGHFLLVQPEPTTPPHRLSKSPSMKRGCSHPISQVRKLRPSGVRQFSQSHLRFKK